MLLTSVSVLRLRLWVCSHVPILKALIRTRSSPRGARKRLREMLELEGEHIGWGNDNQREKWQEDIFVIHLQGPEGSGGVSVWVCGV